MDNHTERLTDGIWRVEVGFYANAYLLANNGRDDGDGLTLVDGGTAKQGSKLVRSIRLLGFDPRALTDLLLTHWHDDHAGSAARFADSSAKPRVWVGREDLGILRGEERPADRLHGPVALVARLGVTSRPAAVPEAAAMAHGQRFGVGGGLQVVATPSHTAGHCAFHLPRQDLLLAGDVLFNVVRFSGGPRLMDADRSARPDALHRLAACDAQIVAVGHGPPITENASGRLSRLVERAGHRSGSVE